jgi:Undecaprenyl-phosphate glucose phosphotransferase
MLRRHHRFFQSMQVLRDVAGVAAAFVLAFWVRFSFPAVLPFGAPSEPRETLIIAAILLGIWPALGWVSGLYTSRRSRSISAELFDVVRVTIGAFFVVVTVTYFVRDVRYSRGTFILWALFTVVLVSAARLTSRLVLRGFRARGYNLRHVLVVGTGELAARVIDTIREQAGLGLRLSGVISEDAVPLVTTVRDAPVVGSVHDLQTALVRHPVDQVLVALPIDRLGALRDIMGILSQETVDVRLVPDFYQFITLCGSIEEFAGLPIINLQATPLVGWNLVQKRAFDIAVAALGLVVLAPALTLVAAVVRLSGPGPVLFRQERIGMDGRRFTMLKFRTMQSGAEGEGARMTARNDPRRTGIGGILRRVSLDELPQLWNVLRGDMSLVGPRPEQPQFIDEFKREIPRYALRHKIKAGMTGWAQVHGLRGDSSMRKRIELDLYYIENWSILLDLKILVRTVLGGFLSPNAF